MMIMTVVRVQLSLLFVLVLNLETAKGSNTSLDVCTTCARTGFKVVRINASCDTLTIRTPDFGRRNYTNNSNCTLILQAGLDPLVLSLRFRHFDVEYSRLCQRDFLCLNGRRFCGGWADGKMFNYILRAQSNFTIFFRTNNNVTRSGFELIVTATLAIHVHFNCDNRVNRKNRRRPRLENSYGCRGNYSRRTTTRLPTEDRSEYDIEDKGGSSEFRPGFLEYYRGKYRYTGSSSDSRSDSSSDSSDSDQSGSPRNRRRHKRSIVSASLPDRTSFRESFMESGQPAIIPDESSIFNEEITISNSNTLINTERITIPGYETIYNFYIQPEIIVEDTSTISEETSPMTEESPPSSGETQSTSEETPSTFEEYVLTTDETFNK